MGHAKLYGTWKSVYYWRVLWGLEIKGVYCECVEDDRTDKRGDLVMCKIPKLIGAGYRTVAESVEFLDYIDRTWSPGVVPFLPRDPHERTEARLWAETHDNQISEAIMKAFFAQYDEQKAEAVEDVQDILKELDENLDGKTFFGDDQIAYADLTLGWLAFWLGVCEEVGEFQAMSKELFPSLDSWMGIFLENPLIKANLPDRNDTIIYFRQYRHGNFYKFWEDISPSSSE